MPINLQCVGSFSAIKINIIAVLLDVTNIGKGMNGLQYIDY